MGHLPEPLAQGIARGVARVMAQRGGPALAMNERHMRRVLASECVLGVSPDPLLVQRWSRRTFDSYARYWSDGARLPYENEAGVRGRFQLLEGEEHLRGAVDRGRGVVMALPHVGSWEWGGAWLGLEGMPMTAVVERLQPEELFEWFVERAAMGLTAVPLGDGSSSALLRALKADEIAGLVSDRDLVGNGVEVEFFGERTTLPAGAAALALRTGRRCFPSSCTRSGHWHTEVVHPPLDSSRQGRMRAWHHRFEAGAHTASHSDWEAGQYVLGLNLGGAEVTRRIFPALRHATALACLYEAARYLVPASPDALTVGTAPPARRSGASRGPGAAPELADLGTEPMHNPLCYVVGEAEAYRLSIRVCPHCGDETIRGDRPRRAPTRRAACCASRGQLRAFGTCSVRRPGPPTETTRCTIRPGGRVQRRLPPSLGLAIPALAGSRHRLVLRQRLGQRPRVRLHHHLGPGPGCYLERPARRRDHHRPRRRHLYRRLLMRGERTPMTTTRHTEGTSVTVVAFTVGVMDPTEVVFASSVNGQTEHNYQYPGSASIVKDLVAMTTPWSTPRGCR